MLNRKTRNIKLGKIQAKGYANHDMTALLIQILLVDSNNTSFILTGITKAGKREYNLTTADFNNAVGNLTLSFTTGFTKGEAGQDMVRSVTFTPTTYRHLYHA